MNINAFFDELDKLAADFKFLGPTAQSYAGTLKALKSGGGTVAEKAAYRGQNITKSLKAVKAMRGGGPAPVVQAAAKASSSPPHQLLAAMKSRVDPAMRSPQIAAAHEAERAAASGRLQAGGRVKLSGLGAWASRNKETLQHGAEIAGLGVLAVPSAQKLKKIRNKTVPEEERRHAKYELGGLGILAAPSAVSLGHAAYKRLAR